MKKIIFVLFVLFVVLNYNNLDMIAQERNNVNEYIVINNSDELEDTLNIEDNVIIYFYQKDCMACNDFKEILNRIIVDKNLQVYGVDLNGSEFNYSDLITDFNLTKTPSVIIFKNNNEIKRIEGTISEDRFRNFINND